MSSSSPLTKHIREEHSGLWNFVKSISRNFFVKITWNLKKSVKSKRKTTTIIIIIIIIIYKYLWHHLLIENGSLWLKMKILLTRWFEWQEIVGEVWRIQRREIDRFRRRCWDAQFETYFVRSLPSTSLRTLNSSI